MLMSVAVGRVVGACVTGAKSPDTSGPELGVAGWKVVGAKAAVFAAASALVRSDCESVEVLTGAAVTAGGEKVAPPEKGTAPAPGMTGGPARLA